MSETSDHHDKKSRDTLCPLNTKSGISSSSEFRIDYTIGPEKRPAPRTTPLLHHSYIGIQMAPLDLQRRLHEALDLTHPAKTSLPGLSFWLWVPTLKTDEERVFRSNTKDFCYRPNCLEEGYFSARHGPADPARYTKGLA
ncbi:hypothetical protein CLAIMM_15151 [Cladophialophora immunda]|nr:hypothetical protein CLAIMM_15151 [Cladophialophora immunda]